jgi:hypothetical protein
MNRLMDFLRKKWNLKRKVLPKKKKLNNILTAIWRLIKKFNKIWTTVNYTMIYKMTYNPRLNRSWNIL